MKYIFIVICVVYQILCLSSHKIADQENVSMQQKEEHTSKLPTVLIVTLFRNKAHTLPNFFTLLNRLDYPKDRIALWLRTDHNEDKTLPILYQWLYVWAQKYHNIDIEYDNSTMRRESEKSSTHWSIERYQDLIRMKEEALTYGRKIWADYVFFLDADVFITRPTTLMELIESNEPIIAPMLLSDGLYSNFWCGMTHDYYYKRTDEYQTIYNYEKQGHFDVPMVHSAVLINLNDKRTDKLTFNKTVLRSRFTLTENEFELIPTDDIILFALSAKYAKIPMKISNEYLYGYVTVPLDAEDDIKKDHQQIINLKIMIINENDVQTIDVEREFERYVIQPTLDTMSFDRIFMINLLRRPERREKMERSFKEIGLEVEHVPAFDGQKLTQESLIEMGVRFLPGYADPFHDRPMTMGEIGCFLSHYLIWEKQVLNEYKEILVLEDDIRFEPYFKTRALELLEEARHIGGWDLIYFGRKRMVKKSENWIEGSDKLVYASYSYWTLGYALSLEGAKKLLDAQPLNNLIPVDEFLPVMFDQHQNDTWKAAFPKRNLVAWSAAPLLLYPTRYTGDDGYLSDTEQSDIVSTLENEKADKKGNKEIEEGVNVRTTDEQTPNSNVSSNNGSIDTTFILNKVNEQVNVHSPTSEHTEL